MGIAGDFQEARRGVCRVLVPSSSRVHRHCKERESEECAENEEVEGGEQVTAPPSGHIERRDVTAGGK